MLINRRRLRVCYTLVLLFVCSLRVHAQTIEDGIMMGKGELQVGNLYSHDSWDEYWEGTLSRRNANIGSITTTTNTWSANYGLTDTLNVIGMVPYIWTRASQGVLHGIDGFQDLTLGVKWNAIERPVADGRLRAIAVVSPAAVHRPGQHARVVARHREFPVQPGLVSDRIDRLHLAVEGATRSPLLLYR